jgi:hypothetical protein
MLDMNSKIKPAFTHGERSNNYFALIAMTVFVLAFEFGKTA